MMEFSIWLFFVFVLKMFAEAICTLNRLLDMSDMLNVRPKCFRLTFTVC